MPIRKRPTELSFQPARTGLRCEPTGGRPIYRIHDRAADARPTVAAIDLAALRRNAARLSAVAGADVGLVAVVKADAYGHGAAACARALTGQVAAFAVSLVEEGIELRDAGIDAPVLVLGSCTGGAHAEVVARRLTPLVGDEENLQRFADAAARAGARLSIHVDIDVGMSRLGVRLERLGAWLDRLQRLPALELAGVCTHLPDADGADAEVTRAQLDRFAAARRQIEAAGFRPAWVHAANSAGLVRFARARYSVCRVGLGLYGYTTVDGIALEPVMTLRSALVSLGDDTSAERTALVPVGFADGYPRYRAAATAGSAAVLVGGRRAHIVGDVGLDAIGVAVTPDHRVGDEVVLIGAQGDARIGADEVARWSGTIPWEITCAVSKRVPRLYIGP